MIKQDLTEELARELEFPLTQARHILEVVIESIVRALKRGERVQVRGFGTFSGRLRGPRMGCNPRTREPRQVPAKMAPHFRASGILSALLDSANPPVGASNIRGPDRSTAEPGGIQR